MPHFDATINIGSLITVGTVIAVWVAFRAKADVLLEVHRELIAALDERFSAHEDKDDARFARMETSITDLVKGVQRLIGRDEVFRRESRGGK